MPWKPVRTPFTRTAWIAWSLLGIAASVAGLVAWWAAARAESPTLQIAVLGDSRIELMDVRDISRGARNYGLSGDDLRHLRDRALTLPLAQADRIVLAGGINDWHTVRLRGFHDRYAALLAALPDRPLVAVAVLPANPAMTLKRTHNRKDFGGSTPLIEAANEDIRALCAARPGCAYVPVPAAMVEPNGELRPKMTTDGVHLTPAGNRVWTAAIRRALPRAER